MGGCKFKLWQAIRASSAAPGYFQEYAIGNDLHQVRLATMYQSLEFFSFSQFIYFEIGGKKP